MKMMITAIALVIYTIGATAVYAGSTCRSSCADGYTYSSVTGSCVLTTTSS